MAWNGVWLVPFILKSISPWNNLLPIRCSVFIPGSFFLLSFLVFWQSLQSTPYSLGQLHYQQSHKYPAESVYVSHQLSRFFALHIFSLLLAVLSFSPPLARRSCRQSLAGYFPVDLFHIPVFSLFVFPPSAVSSVKTIPISKKTAFHLFVYYFDRFDRCNNAFDGSFLHTIKQWTHSTFCTNGYERYHYRYRYCWVRMHSKWTFSTVFEFEANIPTFYRFSMCAESNCFAYL